MDKKQSKKKTVIRGRVKVDESRQVHYDLSQIDLSNFVQIALFFLYKNPFSKDFSPGFQQRVEELKGATRQKGELNDMLSCLFGKRYWPQKSPLLEKDPAWLEPAVSIYFGKTFEFEFAFFQQNSTDSFFISFCIHLRNALAHGRFFCLKTAKESIWFFEDYAGQYLTARICITEASLFNLIDMIASFCRNSVFGKAH